MKLEQDPALQDPPHEADPEPPPAAAAAAAAGERTPQKRAAKRVDFTNDEVDQASVGLRAARTRHETQDLALDSLTSRRRLPQYLYAVIPDAIAAVERALQALQAEVDMLQHDRTHRRQHRFSLRYLLDRGRSIEAIARQVDGLPPASLRQHFGLCMAYLIHYRRLHRLAVAVMEGFVRSSAALDPWLVGMSFHMLLAERLAPFDEADKHRGRRGKMHCVAGHALELLLRILRSRRIKVPQTALYLLATRAPVSMVAGLYWKLKEAAVPIKQFTVFHFTRRLAEPDAGTGASLWRDAMQILDSLQYREEGLCLFPDLAKLSFYAVIYQAMRAGAVDDTARLLKLMTGAGLEPGIEVYNMLLARAAEEKDEASLRRYFEAVRDAGMQPNMVTYSITHAFYKRQRNERMRESALHEACRIDPALNLFLATDALHAEVLDEKPYVDVFRRFQRIFRVRLLEDLALVPALGTRHDPAAERRKLRPDGVTLAVMVTSYCTSERAVANIWRLYTLYRAKMRDRSRANAALRRVLLCNGSFIPHAIMLGLGKRIAGLRHVASVLDDMLGPDAPIEADVYSWSIFLHLLTRAGRMAEAETVVRVMAEHGMEPNAVTFTTLLSGYVRLNMADRAEGVLEQMAAAGVDANVYTWTSLLHGYVKGADNWRAGDAFRRMLDSNIQPDEVTLQAVSGVTDRGLFEAGLAGEPPGVAGGGDAGGGDGDGDGGGGGGGGSGGGGGGGGGAGSGAGAGAGAGAWPVADDGWLDERVPPRITRVLLDTDTM